MAIFLYVVKNSITFTNVIWICKGHIPNSLVSTNTEEKDQEMSNYGCTERKGRDIATQKKKMKFLLQTLQVSKGNQNLKANKWRCKRIKQSSLFK